ncbi:IclR family transcriptional regulator [Azospirillum doebereinerae]
MPSFEPVRAILRGLDVLRVISEAGPITATDIAKQVMLPQPSVIRVLETLISAGYVYRIEGSVTYGVTARTLALSRGFNATSRLVQLATPLIEALRSEIGWPSNLATFDQGAMTIAYTNRSAHGMSIPGRLGARLPVFATGVGIVYLAHLSGDALTAAFAQTKAAVSRWDTNPEILASLDERLEAARRNGYAFAEEAYLDELYHSQIWAVAVPIIVDGKVIAALSSLVLRSAGSRNRILGQILPPLRRTSKAISESLAADAGAPESPPKRTRRG